MKKVVYIVSLGVLVGLASCSKEDIQPTSPKADSYEWSPEASSLDVNDTGFNNGDEDDSEGGGITDPNWDEDGNGKKDN